MSDREKKLLPELVSGNAKKLYEAIRMSPSGETSYAQLQALANLRTRSAAQSAMNRLVCLGLIKCKRTSLSVRFSVRRVRRPESDRNSFRGSLSISVVPCSAALEPTLNADEVDALFAGMAKQPRAAALYRYLRGKLRLDVTMSELSDLFGVAPATTLRWFEAMEANDLVERCYDVSSIFVKTPKSLTTAVDAEKAQEWFQGEAAIPSRTSKHSLILVDARKEQSGQMIFDFFKAAMQSVQDPGRVTGMRGDAQTSRRIARNLSKNHTFLELQGPLLFFVVDWNGDNVDSYGRTLETFSKNLAVIIEEFEDTIRAEPRYVIRQMKRLGLHHDFRLPPEPESGPNEKSKRAIEAARAKYEERWK